MANRRRGEIDVCLDGKCYRACLTLGALPELEAAFGDEDMVALVARFESGRLKSSDAVRVIGAGLRGGGADVTDEAVARMQCERGAAGYVAIVAELLRVTFGGGEADGRAADDGGPQIATDGEGESPAPFPGTT